MFPKRIKRRGRVRFAAPLGIFIWLCNTLFCFAHGTKPHSWQELSRSWAWDPGVLIPLVLSTWLYTRGVRRFWRGGKIGWGIHVWEAWCFAAGQVALIVALVSPLHPWG